MLEALAGSSNLTILTGAVFTFAVVILAVVAVMILRSRSGARFKKRLENYTKAHVATRHLKPSQQSRLLIQGKLGEIEGGKRERSQRVPLIRRFEMAGLRTTLRHFYLLCAVIGLVSFVVPVLFGIPAFPSILLGIAMGLGFPRLVLSYLAAKRRRLFMDGFADAVDIIVRGIQSGLPLGECIAIIGRESPEPIAGEFRMMIETTRLGLNLQQGLERAVMRMPVPEFKFFSIVLSIQQETGGNLADTLSNLSEILRDRKKMKDKVKAMSSEARTTAAIIGCLPFMMGGILFLTSPEYIKLLFLHPMGQLMVGGGVFMLAVGSAVMAKMIAFKI